jgi:transposase
MDEARFGLHTEMRRVWIKKGVRPEVRQQTRYEWDYLYGALEVVEGRAEFLHLPTVNLDCNRLFLEPLRSSDPEAHHVVIADQAGFHFGEGDKRLPEGVPIVSLPPYSPQLNPCEQLWDILKDTEGFANGVFESIENLRKALLPAYNAVGMTRKRCFLLLVAHGCSLKQTLLRKFSSLIILKRWYQFEIGPLPEMNATPPQRFPQSVPSLWSEERSRSENRRLRPQLRIRTNPEGRGANSVFCRIGGPRLSGRSRQSPWRRFGNGADLKGVDQGVVGDC